MKLSIIALFLIVCSFCKGQQPPGSFEIMKWYWNGFPKVHNGWSVEFKETMRMTGWTEGIIFSIVNVCCDTCDYLDKYSFNVVLDYWGDEGTSLSIKQNKDTTDKYMKIKYPLWY